MYDSIALVTEIALWDQDSSNRWSARYTRADVQDNGLELQSVMAADGYGEALSQH